MSNKAPASLAETPHAHHRTFPTSRHLHRSFVPLAEPAIDIQQVRKSFDGHVAVRNLSLQVPSRNCLRPARPQRRRQDHDDPHDPRHHRAGLRHDQHLRPLQHSRTRWQSHRLSPRRAWSVQEDAGAACAPLSCRAERRQRTRGGQAHRALARASLAHRRRQGLGKRTRRGALARHAAESAVHRRAASRARPDHPRRAVQRARSR